MALHLKKEEERVFIRECIRLYRELPALWDTTSDIYKNKFEKSRCYDVLLAKYRERYNDATKEDLKKKINSLRTNYRKELKKQQDSKLRNGCNYYGELYMPSLFYFDDINFLHGQEAPSLADSTLFSITKNEKIDVLDQTAASLSFNIKEEHPITFPAENAVYLQQSVTSNSITTANTIPSSSSGKPRTQNQNDSNVDGTDYMRFCSPLLPNQSIANHKHHHNSHHQFNENNSNRSINHHHHHHQFQNSSVLPSVSATPAVSKLKRPRECNSSTTTISNYDDDEFYHQAKVWAKEVSKMSPDQQLFAKKAINDIIFEGQLGGLHRSSVKINVQIENNAFDNLVVGVGAPEVAMFVPGDDNNDDDDSSSDSLSPPPVSFQT